MTPFRVFSLPYPVLRTVLSHYDFMDFVAHSLTSSKSLKEVQEHFAKKPIRMRVKVASNITTLYIVANQRVVEWCFLEREYPEDNTGLIVWNAPNFQVHFVKNNLKLTTSCATTKEQENMMGNVIEYILENFNARIMEYSVGCFNIQNHPDIFTCSAFKFALKRKITTRLSPDEFAVVLSAPKCKELHLSFQLENYPEEMKFNADAVHFESCNWLRTSHFLNLENRSIQISGDTNFGISQFKDLLFKWTRLELENLEFCKILSRDKNNISRIRVGHDQLKILKNRKERREDGTLKSVERLLQRKRDGKKAKLFLSSYCITFSVLP